jgi:hypothetical protein
MRLRSIVLLLLVPLACSGPAAKDTPVAGAPTGDGSGTGAIPPDTCAVDAVTEDDGSIDVEVVSSAVFGSYDAQRFTVCLPARPFASVEWRFHTEGGKVADCPLHTICGKTGDHVDRIISSRLVTAAGEEIELDRGITSYGGVTDYARDLTAFSPMLHGEVTFSVAVETGCARGYQASATLHLVPGDPPAGGLSRARIAIPYGRAAAGASASTPAIDDPITLTEPLAGASLMIFATGHNSAGKSCEEFCPGRSIVASVDGVTVGTARPEMGGADPSCVAGCDGCGNCQASSVSREGWCPGKPSPPIVFPVGDLAAGPHTISFAAPESDTEGGYWQISAALVAP